MRRWLLLALLPLVPTSVAAQSEAVDPEVSCARQDAHRLEIKPGVGILHAGDNIFRRGNNQGEKIASCELRTSGRTIFQAYERGKVIRRGFFLDGKRSGRWTDRRAVTIYAGGNVIQERPGSGCEPVARIGLALTVYCPRNTAPQTMLSDFKVWDAAMAPKGLLFDVYSSEAKAPDSKATYDAFPEHSEINFAVVKFTNRRLTEFMCIPPKATKLTNCMDLVDSDAGQRGEPSIKKDARGDVYPTQKR